MTPKPLEEEVAELERALADSHPNPDTTWRSPSDLYFFDMAIAYLPRLIADWRARGERIKTLEGDALIADMHAAEERND